MDIAHLQSILNPGAPLTVHQAEQASPSAKEPRRVEPVESHPHPTAGNGYMDPTDPNIQQNTVIYLNKMLRHHGLNLQAELSQLNGHTYIAVSDPSTGSLVRRVRMEDVLKRLGGHAFMIDLST